MALTGACNNPVRMLILCGLLAACEAPAPYYPPVYTPPYDAQRETYRQASNRLQPHMSQAQVEEIMGGQPGSTDMGMCGAQVGKPWACRSVVYGPVKIRFYWDSARGWVVNSWETL